eukprot:scaffold6935_cov45-Attheya_sp.AAC.3
MITSAWSWIVKGKGSFHFRERERLQPWSRGFAAVHLARARECRQYPLTKSKYFMMIWQFDRTGKPTWSKANKRHCPGLLGAGNDFFHGLIFKTRHTLSLDLDLDLSLDRSCCPACESIMDGHYYASAMLTYRKIAL